MQKQGIRDKVVNATIVKYIFQCKRAYQVSSWVKILSITLSIDTIKRVLFLNYIFVFHAGNNAVDEARPQEIDQGLI